MKGGIFHIINRGVEKRRIFLSDDDYLRFNNNLIDFNDKNSVPMSYHDRRIFNHLAIRKPSEELVDILCVCLMPNHYHILVKEKIDGGASLFSKKVSSGYTQYFNIKNKRKGVLFQGKSKIVLIKNNKHFLYIPFYILSNPIKLKESFWKEKGVRNLKSIINFLEEYEWSSFTEIVSDNKDKNYRYLINRKSFFSTFDTNAKEMKKDFIRWLS